MSERSDRNDAADAVNEATTVAMPQVADGAGRNEASDTVSLDTMPMDTMSMDTVSLDTAVLDTAANGAALNDTSVLDTAANCTALGDTVVLDTEASDTVSADTVAIAASEGSTPDTSVLDTAVLDASTRDGATGRSPRLDWDQSRPSAPDRSETRPADRSVPSSVPSYVQVPREAPLPPKVMRKRGPSGATIVFAVFMLLVGGVSLAMGLYFPLTSFTWFTMDPRIAIAMGCAALGGLLIVVAIVWSLATIIHSHKQDKADRAQAAQSADTGMRDTAA